MLKTAGRLAWGATKGTARVAGAAVGGAALMAGFNPLAMAGRISTGIGPAFAAAVAGKKLFQSGFKKKSGGKQDDVINETSIVGPTGKMLAKVHKQVVAIKGLLIDNDPASAQREAAFEEEQRHKRLIAALSGLGGAGGGGAGKEPGSFWDWLKGLLPMLLAGLGLAMLPTLIKNLPAIFEGIQNAMNRIGEFLDAMMAFFVTMRLMSSRAARRIAAADKAKKKADKRAKKAAEKAAKKALKTTRNRHTGSRWKNMTRRFTGRTTPLLDQKTRTQEQKDARKRTTSTRGRPAGRALPSESIVESRARINRTAERFRVEQERIRNQKALDLKRIADAKAETQRATRERLRLDNEKRLQMREGGRSRVLRPIKPAGAITPTSTKTGARKPPVDKRTIDRHAGGMDRITQMRLRMQQTFSKMSADIKDIGKKIRANSGGTKVLIEAFQSSVNKLNSRYISLEERFGKLNRSVTILRQSAFNRSYNAGEFDERMRQTVRKAGTGRKARIRSLLGIGPGIEEKMTTEQKAANRTRGLPGGQALPSESIVESRARTNRSAERYRVEQEKLRAARRASAGKIGAGLGGGPRYPGGVPSSIKGPLGAGTEGRDAHSVRRNIFNRAYGASEFEGTSTQVDNRLTRRGDAKIGVDGKPINPKFGPPLTEAELKIMNEADAKRINRLAEKISKRFGNLSGLKIPEGRPTAGGGAGPSILNRQVGQGPGAAGGPGTGAGTGVTTEAGVADRLFHRSLGKVPLWLRNFTSKFYFGMKKAIKTGRQGVQALMRVPGVRLLGSMVLIAILVSQFGGLVVARAKGDITWAEFREQAWPIAKELLIILALFAGITFIIATALGFAAPALAVGALGGLIANVGSVFITSMIMNMIHGAPLVDPHEEWRKKTKAAYTIGKAVMFEGESWHEKAMGAIIGSSIVAGAAVSQSVLGVADILSGYKSPAVRKTEGENISGAAAGELFTGGARQSMRGGTDFKTDKFGNLRGARGDQTDFGSVLAKRRASASAAAKALMSGASSTGVTDANENALKQAIIKHNSFAIMMGDHLTPANAQHIGKKMALAGVEVYKLLHSGKFSKKVTIILQNTVFETVTVPHIIDNTSTSYSNINIGGTTYSGIP